MQVIASAFGRVKRSLSVVEMHSLHNKNWKKRKDRLFKQEVHHGSSLLSCWGLTGPKAILFSNSTANRNQDGFCDSTAPKEVGPAYWVRDQKNFVFEARPLPLARENTRPSRLSTIARSTSRWRTVGTSRTSKGKLSRRKRRSGKR